MHGQVLEVVASARYLGVDISSVLSWNSHIDRITGNANRTLGFIRRTAQGERDCLQHFSMAPTGVCLPHMGPLFQKEHTPDRKDSQRRAARRTTRDFSTRSSVTTMLEKLGWRSLQQRRADACSIALSMA